MGTQNLYTVQYSKYSTIDLPRTAFGSGSIDTVTGSGIRQMIRVPDKILMLKFVERKQALIRIQKNNMDQDPQHSFVLQSKMNSTHGIILKYMIIC